MFGWLKKGARPVTITRSADLAKRMKEENTQAGVSVSALRALQQATVFSCVKVLSETFAQLSFIVYEELPDGTRRRANDHWLARLLRDNPGDGETPFEFLETLSAELDLYGNHYRYLHWKGDEVLRLIHIRPGDVQVERDKATREIRFRIPSMVVPGKDYFTRKEILHFRDLSLDGLTGLSKIGQCRNTVGLQIACERHGANVFKNGAAPNAVMEFPHELTQEQHKALQEDLDENWSGKNSNRTMILESGGKLVPFATPNKDAQFLETRQYGRTEIAGIFRVPPHMIGDLSRSTFSNIEQQSLEFVMYAIVPRVKRFESLLNSTLLAGTNFYVEGLIDSLVRGDIRTRMDSYSRAISSGVMTPDEARAKENLPKDPSGNGAKLFMMANVVPIEKAGEVSSPAAAADPLSHDPLAQDPNTEPHADPGADPAPGAA